MNAYFASVEQQLRPSLRGKPIAVVPTRADSTCCIAVSYEARPYGIKTGTQVGEARRRCRRLQLVEARPAEYVRIHHEIIAAVERVLPVEKVASIDEMACRLSPQHRHPKQAVALAQEVKRAIAQNVGVCLRSSIGLATNPFLAKVASNLQKPDGLTVITQDDLPQKLYSMALDDFPGIAGGMLARLHRVGIHTVQQLCALSREQMQEAWQSVVGQHWWHLLRGEELPEVPTRRRTVGHSHVLPPESRTEAGSRAVMVRLICKGAMRLRRLDYWAQRLRVSLSYLGDAPKWKRTMPLGRCQDTPAMLKAFEDAWQSRPPGGKPFKVSITLLDLIPGCSVSAPLFAEERRAVQVSHLLDTINARCGKDHLYFASMHEARQAAPTRIAFTHIPEPSDLA